MKKHIFVVSVLALALPLVASAHGNYNHSFTNKWNNWQPRKYVPTRPPVSTPTVPTPAPTPTPPPVPVPVTPPVAPAPGEVVSQMYTTGYAARDNTPAGSTRIDMPGHTGNAGGTGTYADPITVAVGHSIINGNDIPDFAYGTMFYIPNVQRYFKASDLCGDGNQPQNGPCHTGYQGKTWIDLYVGASLDKAVLTCEDNITGIHTVILNPASTHKVTPGAIYETGCKQYGETIL